MSLIEKVTQVGNSIIDLVNAKTANTANVDLSNLSDEGLDKIASGGSNGTLLTDKHITNCLIEAPQAIKYTFKNGIFTLLAGSYVVVPNGVNVYERVTIEQDRTLVVSANPDNELSIFYSPSTNSLSYNATSFQCFSGDSQPETTQTTYSWWDTSTNLVKSYNNEAFSEHYKSLPICTINTNGIVNPFQGIGFIGDSCFVFDVKSLAPNGRNEDGSLKNLVREVTFAHLTNSDNFSGSFYLMSAGPSSLHRWSTDLVHLYDEIPSNPSNYTRWFSREDNYWYEYLPEGVHCPTSSIVGLVEATNNRITKIKNTQLFRATNYGEFCEFYNQTCEFFNQTSSNLNNKANTSDVVKKSGDTMTGNLKIHGGSTQHVVQCISNLLMSENPAAATGVGKFQVLDKNGNYLMQVGCERNTEGRNSAFIRAHSPADWNNSAQIAIMYMRDGTVATYAPTPAAADNSTKIATTAWVRTLVTNTTIGIPNYNAGVSVTWATLIAGYTAPSKGVLMMMIYPASRKDQQMTVNGKKLPYVVDGPSSDADNTNITIILNKGDVYKIGTNNNTAPREFNGAFYPFKGV